MSSPESRPAESPHAQLLKRGLEWAASSDRDAAARLLEAMLRPLGSDWIGVVEERRDGPSGITVLTAATEIPGLAKVAEIGPATRLKTLVLEALRTGEPELFRDPPGVTPGLTLPVLQPCDGLVSALVLPLPADAASGRALCLLSRRPDAYEPSTAADLRDLAHLIAVQNRAMAMASMVRNNELLLESRFSSMLQSSKMSAVGQLASGVAHEFNNLIAAIYGYAQFMKDNREERVLKKGISIILSSSERARDLTRSLLTFSRNSEGRCEAADLNEVLSDSLLLVEQQIAKEDIQLVRNFGRLPHAWVDRGRLQEVFLNIISNARHAMPEGGQMTLTTSALADHLVVEISDTGVGIPAENLGRIFDPFFTTKGPLNGTRTPGTGLGLFTVYNIIQTHQGSVDVTSEPGRGTTVRICLPAHGQQSGGVLNRPGPAPGGLRTGRTGPGLPSQ